METEAKRRKTTPSESTIFKPRRDFHLNTTELHVYLLCPLNSLSTAASPWIVTIATNSASPTTNQYRHSLTGNLFNIPANFDWCRVSFKSISESNYCNYANASFDKLLVFPYPVIPNLRSYKRTFLALYKGGKLRACPVSTDKWIRVNVDGDRHGCRLYDDLIMFNRRIYVVDTVGKLSVITCRDAAITMGKPVIYRPVDSWSRRRYRLVDDRRQMYLVVSLEGEECDTKELLQVYKRGGKTGNIWEEVKGFEGSQVLFISRDSYFFISYGISEFPGIEYKDCIMFSKDAFAFRMKTEGGCENEEDENEEDSIAIFRLSDGTFVKDGENEGFPKIIWEPPAWVFDAVSGSAESTSRLQSWPDKDDGFDSNSRDKMDGELLSGLKDSDSKDMKYEEIQSDLACQDKKQEGMESDSCSQDQEDGKQQCDSNRQEKKDEEMPSNVNVQGRASMQRELSPSPSGGEDEVTRILLGMNSENVATEQESPKENITQSVPRNVGVLKRACTSSTTKSQKSDSTTAKFEGFVIRCDLVPTLQKIWQKHGNILENSIFRSGDIVGRALESLATMVRILEDNSAHSLSSSQADYLTSTLSDLKCMCFEVCWLTPFVEKAVQRYQNKPLLDSVKNLHQLSAQVKERRAIHIEELTKLSKEENKLKEDIANLSKKIPISEQVKFDEPLGIGLT